MLVQCSASAFKYRFAAVTMTTTHSYLLNYPDLFEG
jgi:hypothetical protein